MNTFFFLLSQPKKFAPSEFQHTLASTKTSPPQNSARSSSQTKRKRQKKNKSLKRSQHRNFGNQRSHAFCRYCGCTDVGLKGAEEEGFLEAWFDGGEREGGQGFLDDRIEDRTAEEELHDLSMVQPQEGWLWEVQPSELELQLQMEEMLPWEMKRWESEERKLLRVSKLNERECHRHIIKWETKGHLFLRRFFKTRPRTSKRITF